MQRCSRLLPGSINVSHLDLDAQREWTDGAGSHSFTGWLNHFTWCNSRATLTSLCRLHVAVFGLMLTLLKCNVAPTVPLKRWIYQQPCEVSTKRVSLTLSLLYVFLCLSFFSLRKPETWDQEGNSRRYQQQCCTHWSLCFSCGCWILHVYADFISQPSPCAPFYCTSTIRTQDQV